MYSSKRSKFRAVDDSQPYKCKAAQLNPVCNDALVNTSILKPLWIQTQFAFVLVNDDSLAVSFKMTVPTANTISISVCRSNDCSTKVNGNRTQIIS